MGLCGRRRLRGARRRELFASGCQLLISMTSAGQIIPSLQPPPYFIFDPIERSATKERATTMRRLRSSAWPTLHPTHDCGCSPSDLRLTYCRSRRHLDDGCAVPRDGRGDHGRAASRYPGGRNGGGGALCLRQRAAGAGAVLRACHQPDGTDRRRLREGRSKWQPGLARHHPRSGRRIPQGVR